VLTAVCLTTASPAFAQRKLTAKDIIGDAVPDVSPTKHADVEEAIKHFGLGDPNNARRLLDEAKKKDPTLPPTELTLAKMYILAGNSTAGRSTLEEAANKNPKDPEPFLIYADQVLSQGNIIEADALYDKALELSEAFTENPKRKRNLTIRSRWGRAQVAERRKDWTSMTAELQALLKIDEYYAPAHYRLGIALCMQDKFQDGFASFERARKEDANLPNQWLATALMFDRRGIADRARQAYERAMKDFPKDLPTITNYATWLIKTEKLNDAEARLAEARISHPEALEVYALSGVAARMNGKTDEAEKYFVTALGKAPAHIGVMSQLATLLVGQEDEQKQVRALQFAAMNARLNSESADANVTLAWVNFKLGRTAEASNALRTGLQQGALSPDSTYLVAEIITAQNRPEDKEAAKKLLAEALAEDQTGIFVHRKEAQALLKKLGGP
jgi:Tfp pilus assembly protein PilF